MRPATITLLKSEGRTIDWLTPERFYYFWAVILVAVNLVAWASSLFMLPGNWFIVLFTALFVVTVPVGDSQGISWWVVLSLVVLAVLGEILELVTGARGAAKQGASRRALLLSMVGAMIGSLVGATVLMPVPVVGPILGAIAGGAFGAFGGAYFGETWVGKGGLESFQVSKAALWGRLLGTVGKVGVGIIMVVVATVDSFF